MKKWKTFTDFGLAQRLTSNLATVAGLTLEIVELRTELKRRSGMLKPSGVPKRQRKVR